MGGQIFKFIFLQFWLQIQIPLKNVSTQIALLFLKYKWKHCQKFQKPQKKRVSSTRPIINGFYAFLIMFPLEFLKKMSSLCRHFFETNLNLQSELKKMNFENRPPIGRGKVNLEAGRVQYLQEIGNFEVAIKLLSHKLVILAYDSI